MTMEDLMRKVNHPELIRNPMAYICSFADYIIKHLVQETTRTKEYKGKYLIESSYFSEHGRLLTQTEYQQCLNEIRNLLQQLPEAKARFLELEIFGNLSVDEMCNVLGYKTKDVFYSVRSQSRKLFRELLEQSNNQGILKELVTLNQTKNEGPRY